MSCIMSSEQWSCLENHDVPAAPDHCPLQTVTSEDLNEELSSSPFLQEAYAKLDAAKRRVPNIDAFALEHYLRPLGGASASARATSASEASCEGHGVHGALGR